MIALHLDASRLRRSASMATTPGLFQSSKKFLHIAKLNGSHKKRYDDEKMIGVKRNVNRMIRNRQMNSFGGWLMNIRLRRNDIQRVDLYELLIRVKSSKSWKRERKTLAEGKMSSAGKKGRCSSLYSVWQQMEADLLVKIFTTLSITDLVFGVSHVCQSWRSACQDPVLWETADLNGLCSNPSYIDPCDRYAVLYSQFCWTRLRTILNHVSDLAGNKVKRLLFDYRLRTKDEDLVFVARRFPGLKHLAIPNCNEITVEGFRNAIQIWTQLESLIIEYVNKPCMIIRLIGVHCRNFSSLKIMFPFDLEFANSLFLYIPGLKILSIRKTLIDRDALNYFLMLVDDLVALNISHSQIVVVHQASLMNHVSAEDVRASKVRVFYWCDQSTCIACRFRPSAETVFRCFEREMNLWRQDEIASLSC